ncbi:hypothetical protein ACWBC2_10530 [Salegentibacter agarivorans]
MKKLLLSFTLLCFSLSSYSQNFQPGYFIDNEGEKIECLIDNPEAIKNPEGFQYKLSQNDEIKDKSIEEVKVFEILNTPYKFERAIVNLDLSKDDHKNLDDKRDPNYTLDTLFLQVAIEGKASLYSYKSKNLPARFFYSMDKGKIEPLIFKKYLVDDTKIRTNNRYKQQLINNLECHSIDPVQFSNLKYKDNSLIEIFTKYNNCQEEKFVNFTDKRRKGEWNLAVKAGVYYSAIKFVQMGSFSNEQDSDSFLSPRLGVEIEYIFPFLNNKFSILSSPSFQYSKTSNETLIYKKGFTPSNPDAWAGEKEDLFIDYSRIIIPLGIRYYYHLEKDINLYLQGAAVANILTDPSGAYNLENFQSNFTFKKTIADPNIDLGTGIRYKKMSLEIIYSINNVMRNEGFNGKLKNPITLNFGYNIL